MRQALRGLTTRGRAFVAAGITASLCALLLGQKDLLRVGILLVALPVVAALVVGRTRLRLQVRRSLTPNQVPVGSQATVELALSNQGRMPAGLLLLEDRIPYVLGHRPRFVVDRVSPNWRRTVSYPVKSDVRGLFQVGPLMLTVATCSAWWRPAGRSPAASTCWSRRGSTGCLRSGWVRTGGSGENRRGRSRRPARRTRRSASTATATTCAGCTGARPRDAAS